MLTTHCAGDEGLGADHKALVVVSRLVLDWGNPLVFGNVPVRQAGS